LVFIVPTSVGFLSRQDTTEAGTLNALIQTKPIRRLAACPKAWGWLWYQKLLRRWNALALDHLPGV